MNDRTTDKRQHLMPTEPLPDGVSTNFAVPDTRLVSGTIDVFLDGERLDLAEYSGTESEYIHLTDGRVVFDDPPAENAQLRVSYYFQWFDDEELEEFLNSGCKLVGAADPTDDVLPQAAQPPVLSLAAYYAYMKMAANSAQALSGGAAGFTADNSKEHPNWMAMAQLAWDTAQKELEMAGKDPISSVKPAMRFVTFALPRYVPRS